MSERVFSLGDPVAKSDMVRRSGKIFEAGLCVRPTANGPCQRVFDAPAVLVHSRREGFRVDAGSFTPFDERERLSVKSNPSAGSSIPALRSLCRPSHVFRLIIAVVVDAIYGVLRRRPESYIANKCGEIAPFRAALDSPASVVSPHPIAWTVASSAHSYPNSVLRRMASAVFESSFGDFLLLKASARTGQSSGKCGVIKLPLRSAHATTSVSYRLSSIRSALQDGQASVCFPCLIYKFHSTTVANVRSVFQ